jgi:ABC-2 type transport system permease protein
MVFNAETKRLVSYRVQFWCELVLSTIVEVLVTVAVWQAVYAARDVKEIGGYTLGEMLLYVILAVFFGMTTRGSGTGTFARDIYDGSLTKYLVYPLSVYSYKLGTYLPRSLFAVVGGVLALISIRMLGHWPADVALSFPGMCMGGVALFLATLLFFLMLFCVEVIAFWVEHVWALSVILTFCTMLLSGKWIPIDLFPVWLQHALEYSPFPYLVFFPLNIFLGRVPGSEVLSGMLLLMLWIGIVFAISQLLYRRGLRSYTGVGI